MAIKMPSDTGTSYTTRVQPSGVDFIRRKLGLCTYRIDEPLVAKVA